MEKLQCTIFTFAHKFIRASVFYLHNMLKTKMIYFMLLLITVYGKEIEDDSGKYQYMEIFRDIPRLFEYFLSRLAEKPEVLEKDDITVFVRSANFNNEYGRVKRDGYCEDLDKPLQKEVKRETTFLSSHVPNESKFLTAPEVKRETKLNIIDSDKLLDKDVGDIKDNIDKQSEQTKRGINSNLNNEKQYCVTQEYAKNCNNDCSHNVKRDAVNLNYEVDTNIEMGRKTNGKRDEIKNGHSLNIKKVGKKLNKLPKKVKKIRKRYSIAESKLFDLSPEDVEDTALWVEQMLEVYNNKQSKEVN